MLRKGAYANDIEKAAADDHLYNESVSSIHWDGISVTTRGKALDGEKVLLKLIDGSASAGKSAFIFSGLS